MSNDAFVGLRISVELKRRIVEIAEETHRSMSQAIILLLGRGIEIYEEDGYLIDTKARPKPKPVGPAEKAKPAKKGTSRRK